MSGHKKALVSISQEEYQRLYQLEAQLRHGQYDLPPILQEFSQLANDVLQKSSANLLEAQTGLQAFQTEWQNEFKQALTESTMRLMEQACAHDRQLQQDFTLALDSLEQAAREALEQQYHSLQSFAADMASQVQDWRDEGGRGCAEWILQVEELLRQYDRQLAPSEKDRCRSALELARQNKDAGLGGQGLVLAQQAFLDLLSAIRQADEQALHSAAALAEIKADLYTVWQDLLANPSVKFSIPEEPSTTIAVDLDLWSGRQYSSLIGEVQAANNFLAGIDFLPEGDLAEWSDRIQEFQARFQHLIETVRQQVITAQLQANIATEMLRAFSAQGYRLASIQAERPSAEAINIRLIDAGMNEISISVTPAGSLESFVLELQTRFSDFIAEDDAENRKSDIAAVLTHAFPASLPQRVQGDLCIPAVQTQQIREYV